MRMLTFFLLIVLCFFMASTANAREWVNTKGQKLNAEFVRFDGDDAIILKRDRDGKEMNVKISKLSAEDREYVKSLRTAKQPSGGKRDGGRERRVGADNDGAIQEVDLPEINFIVVAVLLLVNIPIYLLMGKGIFGDMSGFFEALRYVLTPNIISMFRGEWGEDWWQTMKFNVFVVACILLLVGEYWVIHKFFLS